MDIPDYGDYLGHQQMNFYAVPCPECGAAVGAYCPSYVDGVGYTVHEARRLAAETNLGHSRFFCPRCQTNNAYTYGERCQAENA